MGGLLQRLVLGEIRERNMSACIQPHNSRRFRKMALTAMCRTWCSCANCKYLGIADPDELRALARRRLLMRKCPTKDVRYCFISSEEFADSIEDKIAHSMPSWDVWGG